MKNFFLIFCLSLHHHVMVFSVDIYPNTTIQTVVNANPAGTSYTLKSGTFRMQSVVPKNNDIYIGESGTILTGGRVLTSFQRDGTLYYAENQTQQGQVHGECDSTHPRCGYPEDFFFDNKPFLHVASKADVNGPGKYFFDYDADRIYFYDDPTGHTVETSVTRNAFAGNASGVTIASMRIEKFAIPAQMGAIGDQYPGLNWVVKNCEITLNHGTGVNINGAGQVVGSKVNQNGQKGIGVGGDKGLIQDNELGNNNYAGFNTGWEAGGTKFWDTNGLIVRGNYAHDNYGPGVWSDYDNINILYENNIIVNNSDDGIKHEIGYTSTIRGNIACNNGWGQSVWLWGSDILLQNSQNGTVYNNTVLIGPKWGNGISIIQQNRGTGEYGEWLGINNKIYNNTIIFQATRGETGAVADWNPDAMLNGGNSFNNNIYHVANEGSIYFSWVTASYNWTNFQKQGQETDGKIDTTVVIPAQCK